MTRELIEAGTLRVAFQPIVDVSSGAVWAYEALGRSTTGRNPASLLAAAHAEGCLLTLDRHWRSLAIEAFREVAPPTRCALNVDARVADDPRFAPGFTHARIEAAGLSPERFVLELTETEGSRTELVERTLTHYAAQGFLVALDDVGARGQSLERVLRLRPQILKLDASLVRGIHADGARRQTVRSLVGLAESMDARVVAEGIETRDELVAALRQGVHFVQGFFVGRPAPRPAAPDGAFLKVMRSAARGARAPREREFEQALLDLLERLPSKDLDATLELVTEAAARTAGSERASLRLLDAQHSNLLVAARCGPSMHEDPATPFAVGEGLIGSVVAHNRTLRLARASEDERFSPKPGMRSIVGSFLGVPLRAECGACIGVLATSSDEHDVFDARDEERLRLLAAVVAPLVEVRRLRRLAQTDALTRLLNRHALDDVLPAAGERAALAVGLADIDHFKRVNDRYGHAAGDEALRAVAVEVAAAVRTDDRVLRLGGEEFLVVLPGSDAAAAVACAERIRARVAEGVSVGGERLTMSIGVAVRESREARETLLGRADAALYAAKRAGRDRVVLAASARGRADHPASEGLGGS